MATVAPSAETSIDAYAPEAVLHDVRGHLTVIRGQCYAVVRDGRATAATIERLRVIDEEVDRIAAAIERTRVALREADMGDRSESPVDMVQIARQALSRLGGLATARGVSMHLRTQVDAALVAGCAVTLGRAVDNLLLNAIGAAERGTVDVVVRLRSQRVELRIANDLRAERPERGWGLGLQIVRDIAARYGGSLRIAEVRGRVSATLDLPVLVASSTPEAA